MLRASACSTLLVLAIWLPSRLLAQDIPTSCYNGLPPLLSSNDSCADGYECQDFDGFDICAPNPGCTLVRLEPVKYCPRQGDFEPELCPPGHYCVDGNKFICPKGYFCLWGTSEPTKCETLSYCPEGSSRRYTFGPLLAIFLLDFSAVGCVMIYRKVSSSLRQAHRLRRKELLLASGQIHRSSIGTLNSRFTAGLPVSSLPVVTPRFSKTTGFGDSSSSGSDDADAIAEEYSDDDADAEKATRQAAVSVSEAGATARTPGGTERTDMKVSYHEDVIEASLQKDLSITLPSNQVPLIDKHEHRGSFLSEAIANSAIERLQRSFARATRNAHINIDFEGLSLKLDPPIDKVVLSNVSGSIEPGRVMAVMGPSGAGKTTFVNVLMNKVRKTAGTVLINDRPGEISSFKKAVGFVPQEDIMMRELTVRQNIAYSARCRLPSDWTSEQIDNHVDDILEVLGLDGVSESPIGDETKRGVSGGQRKRVNIGIELAACPVAMFVDEPTSGLDATAALEVCSVLRRIANLGLVVVAVLHQPRAEIVRQLDDVLLLRPGGETLYLGPQSEMIKHFEDMGFEFEAGLNAADVLMDIASGKGKKKGSRKKVALRNLPAWGDTARGKKIAAAARLHTNGHSNGHAIVPSKGDMGDDEDSEEAIDVSHYGASFLRQLLLAHNRALKQQQAHITPFIMENFVAIFAGTVLGLSLMNFDGTLYTGILRPPYTALSSSPLELIVPMMAFIMGVIVSISSAPPGVSVFGDEIIVYWREAASGHNRLAYYLGKTIASSYRMVIMSAHFVVPALLIGSPRTRAGDFFVIVFCQVYIVYGISAVVSAVIIRGNKSLIALIVCMVSSSLCGFAPNLQDYRAWGFGWFLECSPFRWVGEAFYHTEISPTRHVFDVEFSAEFWGYELDRYGMDLGLAFMIGTIFRVIAFVALIGLNRQKQK